MNRSPDGLPWRGADERNLFDLERPSTTPSASRHGRVGGAAHLALGGVGDSGVGGGGGSDDGALASGPPGALEGAFGGLQGVAEVDGRTARAEGHFRRGAERLAYDIARKTVCPFGEVTRDKVARCECV